MTIDSTRGSHELGGHSEEHNQSQFFESANTRGASAARNDDEHARGENAESYESQLGESAERNESQLGESAERNETQFGESADSYGSPFGESAESEGAPLGDDDATGSEAAPAKDASAESTERRRRRRGSRGGRRRRGARKGEEGDAPLGEAGALAADDDEATSVEEDDASVRASGPATAGRAPSERTRATRSTAAPREIGFEDIDALETERAESIDTDDAPSADAPPLGEGPRKKSRRRRRRRGAAGPEGEARSDSDSSAEDGPVEPLLPDEDDLPVRTRSLVPRDLDHFPLDSGAPPVHDDDQAPLSDGPGGGKKRRRRGSRGGRRRKQQLTEGRFERSGRTVDLPAEIEAIPGEEDDLPILTEIGDALDPAEADPARGSEGGRSRRGKKRGGERRPAAQTDSDQDDDDLPVIPESQRTSIILVNATDPEEQRVAVCEGDRIVDFQMTVRDQDSLVNDIYRGRVVNLEPAIGAAFIDFGQGRNGFLHTSDVLSIYGDKDWSLDKLLSAQIDPEEWDSGTAQPQVGAEVSDDEDGPKQGGSHSKGGTKKGGRKFHRPKGGKQPRFRARPRLPITELLKKGQMVVVQVTKDAIGDKGPTLTTYISIPGRYLVLMPSMSRTGVSRKIEDEKERKRLKRILQSLDVPEGMGVIVRTAGVGHSKAEIKRDLDYLKGAWEAFGNRLNSGHGPAPLYRESDVAIRTMRDLFTPTTKAVVVDDPEVHRHITEFAEKLMPEDVQRVKLHTGARPLFQSYGIEPDFEKIFSRRIELPSGGSVVFDSAEALVAIDVNSGRTRSDGFDFEEIALKTNLEAVPEIARQIRLRDLGGIIVVDFIDMMKMGNIRTVERAFAKELENDRARSKIGRISQFGLLELTRQRLGPGIAKKAFHSCPRCRGTGRIRTVNSRAAAILRRLGSAMILKGFSTVEVKAHPEVIAYLKDSCSEYIRALEYRFTREVKLYDAPEQHEDSVLRYLRADGKEVRPGGRRKR